MRTQPHRCVDRGAAGISKDLFDRSQRLMRFGFVELVSPALDGLIRIPLNGESANVATGQIDEFVLTFIGGASSTSRWCATS